MKSKTPVLLIIIISICCALLFVFMSFPISRTPIYAEKGVLNLRTVDLTKQTQPLQGEWLFSYGHVYTPDKLEANFTHDEYVRLPSSWSINGNPSSGSATYGLHLLTTPNADLMLYVPEILTASAVWIDGEPMYENGKVSQDPLDSVVGVKNEFIGFTANKNGDTQIVIQVSNRNYSTAGMPYEIIVAHPDAVMPRILSQRIAFTLIVGMILMIGIYHMIAFASGIKDRLFLTFGIVCVLGCISLFTDTNSVLLFFTEGGFGEPFIRIRLIALFALNSAIVWFAENVFRLKQGGLIRAIYILGCICPALLMLMLPLSESTWLTVVSFVPPIIATARAGYYGKYRHNTSLKLFLVSLILYLTFSALKYSLNGYIFMPTAVAILFMVLMQTMLLARNYVSNIARLEDMNANLETMVEDRTLELRQSQNTLRDMIGNISHDLKTPLTVVGVNLEMLHEGLVAPEEQQAFIDIAYNKNLDLQRLINSLFDITSLEARAQNLHMEWVELATLMNELKERYKNQIKNENIDFRIGLRQNCQLRIEKTMVLSVFDNCVYNALRYTPEGGHIAIEAHRPAHGVVRIDIMDTGCGISEEYLPHIFERFYKGDSSRGSGGSSGLGLYIVQTSMENMGGSVSATSTLNQGTTISLTFPVRDFKKDVSPTGKL